MTTGTRLRSVILLGVPLVGWLSWAGAAGGQPVDQAAEFYLSPSGNDHWSGRVPKPDAAGTDGPFRTFERARDAIRTLKREHADGLPRPVTVWVGGGTYQLDRTWVLEAIDSGHPDRPVTYAASPGETPVISGGRPVKGWNRGADGRWSAPVPTGPTGAPPSRHLFVGDARRPRCRHPDSGFLQGLTTTDSKSLTFPEGHLRAWSNPAHAELMTLVEWSPSRVRVGDARVEGNRADFPHPILQFLDAPWAGHIRANVARFPYYFENAPELLDATGEWYGDPEADVITYLPLAGEQPAAFEAVVSGLETLVQVRGTRAAPVEHLRFRGLTFSHTGWTLPAGGFFPSQAGFEGVAERIHCAVEVEYGRGVGLEGCRLVQLGGGGIRLGRGCQDCRVDGGAVEDVSGNGIELGVREPLPESPADLVRGNTIVNATIRRCGVEHAGCVGVWVGITERTTVTHNEVADLPYTGISVGWKWDATPTATKDNVVEFNHIHHVMQLLSDGGGVYVLGFQPGSIIRGNLIHDVTRSTTLAANANNGIFLDNGSKGWHIEGNIIYAAADGATRMNADPAEMTWGANTMNVDPAQPQFPKDAAERAGPRAAP